MKILRTEAINHKTNYREKYKHKLRHLQTKYREDEETKLNKIPVGLEDFANLTIFDKNKFSKIKPTIYDAATVGSIRLDEDEKAVLCSTQNSH